MSSFDNMEILQTTNKSVNGIKVFLQKDLLSILQKGSAAFSANIIDRLSSIVIFWLVARIYGASPYGQVVTAFTVCGLIDIILQMGLPIFIQRETARKNADIREYLYKAFYLRLFSFFLFLLSAAGYYFLFLAAQVSLIKLCIIVLAVFVNSISQIFVSYYYGLNRNHIVLKSVFSSRLLFIAGSLLVIWEGLAVEYILILFAVTYFYQFIIFSKDFGFRLSEFKLAIRKQNGDFHKRIRNECIPLVISAGLVVFYDRIDVLIISGIKDFSAVAFYNIAYNIYKLPLVGFSLLFTPVFTAYSRKYNEHSLDYKEILKFGFVVFIISLTISTSLFALSDTIILFVYGSGFSKASAVLKYLSFAFVFLVLNNYTNLLINSMNLNKENIKIFILSLLVNVVLNIILVRSSGILGAAVATVITEMLVLLAQIVLIKSYLTKNYTACS